MDLVSTSAMLPVRDCPHCKKLDPNNPQGRSMYSDVKIYRLRSNPTAHIVKGKCTNTGRRASLFIDLK